MLMDTNIHSEVDLLACGEKLENHMDCVTVPTLTETGVTSLEVNKKMTSQPVFTRSKLTIETL